MRSLTAGSFLFALSAFSAVAAEPYHKPSQAVLDVLNAPAIPVVSLSPARTHAMQSQPVRYPPIAELAQPVLRLAGLRINPKTNGPYNVAFSSSMLVRQVPDGTEIPVQLPQSPKLGPVRWSPDGSRFAFSNTTPAGIELWIGETATGKTRRIENLRVNAVLVRNRDVQWMPDGKTLLVTAVRPNRGVPPPEPTVPPGPRIQESTGGAGPERTHQDMLQNGHDEDLFEYYATSQVTLVDAVSGKGTAIGKAGIIESALISPDGKNLLITMVHRPFSYLHSVTDFPKEIEVWDRTGAVVHKVASLPLQDKVPIEGVPTGPRGVEWRPSQAATLVWVEALDAGDPRKTVPHRDRVMVLKSPFTGQATEIFKTAERCQGVEMAATGGLALVSDYDRKKRWARTFAVNLDGTDGVGQMLFSRSVQDRYGDPGRPLEKMMPNGQSAIIQDGDSIYLTGAGSSPEGDRPFLRRFRIASQQTEELFRCDGDHYEIPVALLDERGTRFLTRRESPTEPPNYFVRVAGGAATALTKFADPQPSIRGIKKQLVKYKRPDGVDLSFTLYLPPNYKQGTRLPTVVWAYPYEFTDASTAGQVSGSTKRFTEMTGYSQLFFLLDGYAVLDNTAMPVVGDPETVNNTYIEQIVADSKAAIDKAAEMGVTDPARVGVGGHSYGGFMTANLLAHCDLFKAGIAESAAHNRTLTPFGFQSERRTIWQAPDVYMKMSPFLYADKIKEPMLLIHGEADDNDGTFPIQSQRMYEAVRGNGGIVRLVFLPYEAHGYRAKETIEHVLWEKTAWFDKHLKGAAAQSTPPSAQ